MTKEEMQQAVIESLQNGTLQPATIILGDNVLHKIEKVEAGGIGIQINHNHNYGDGAIPIPKEKGLYVVSCG